MADYYDNEDSSQKSGTMDTMDEGMDTPDEKLGLVPMSFFNNKVNPGDHEMVEVVKVYDNEVAIKCVYGKEADKEPEEEMSAASSPSESESSDMMG